MSHLSLIEGLGIGAFVLGAWLLNETVRNPRRPFKKILIAAFKRHRHDHHRVARFLGILAVGLVLLAGLVYILRSLDNFAAGGPDLDEGMIENRQPQK